MSNEQLQIFDLLWKSDKPEFHGKYYDFPAVSVSPAPVQKPRFPIWTGGESEAAVKRAAKYADAWFSYHVKITAEDMMRFGVIDRIVPEPAGGAHRDPVAAIAATGEAIAGVLDELAGLDRETVRRQRREKFLAIGRGFG